MERALPNERWSNRSWHRRASRPVTVWMMLFLIAGLTHVLIPNYQWVLIHIFTLGVVTNSIVVWSQHLTEKFLQQRSPDSDRRFQVARIGVLQVGIVCTIAGQWLLNVWDRHWVLTQVGAGIIAVVLVWHALALGRQWWAAPRSKPFRPAVAGYVGSSLALPAGAVFGGLLAMDLPGDWHERLLGAHTVVNLGGFVGLAAAASLTVLFPAIWRTRGLKNRAAPMLALIAVGIVVAVVGSLIDAALPLALGLLIFVAGWLVGLTAWLGNVAAVARDPRGRITYPSLSILAAVLWLVGTVTVHAVRIIAAGPGVADLAWPTVALLVGFAAQLLLGVMSNLLPTTMGGGPAAVRAGLTELNRIGLFRLTLINLGLAVWLASSHSWLKVVMSVLCLGSLALFVLLLIRSVRAQRRVLLDEAAGPPVDRGSTPPWNQVTAGVATVALIVALFGGLHGPGAVPTTTQATGDEDVTEVEVTTIGMAFVPDRIEVPAGHQLIITFTNTDSMDHDLKFANGLQSGRLSGGESAELDLGVITEDIPGWCTIAGHRAQGMVLDVVVRN